MHTSSLRIAPHSAKGHGHDPGTVASNLEEHGHGEVEVLLGRVAPNLGRLGVVGRAKVGGGDPDDGPVG